jgi:hypothetical protein
MKMNRRNLLQGLAAIPAAVAIRLQAAGQQVNVYKTPTCGCCGMWVAHMRKNGFDLKVQDVDDTTPYRAKYGVPEKLGSCHTAVVDGYAIEGHVPASEIQRMLKERPNAKGLAVPGMVTGSPGMEGGTPQPYDVLLFTADGKSTVYQHYPRK